MLMDDLRDIYHAELQELRSIEAMLVGMLPKMAAVAKHRPLRELFETHLEETRGQLKRLDHLIAVRRLDATEHVDQTMQAILREAERAIGLVRDPYLRDAGLISSARRTEYYELAAYHTCVDFARVLELHDDARLLQELLRQQARSISNLDLVAEVAVYPEANALEVITI
ncbi:ferritin-like domain-containing protein [Methylorubrum rhodesianum]|uniref:YciE/YciF ferroxidase family protein n=1 Tax=Methylorubrum rhodesianum TaxID=29427 RepID=UPI003D02480C